ncbi:MAG: hypothetical protein IPM96_07980 [Ignavibacteria bacterium]|nr:hypothetical protein [Ignavibacteria bacterium]
MLANKSPRGINPETFNSFIYSKNSHFKYFQENGIDTAVFGKTIEPEESDARIYQNLLVFAYVTQNLKPGSVILEIGNSESPVFKALSLKGYECRLLNFKIKDLDADINDSKSAEIEWILKTIKTDHQ